jgi:hypothetical protein
MRFLQRSWWTAPLVSFNWIRALDLASESKYKAALKRLTLIEKLRGPNLSPMGGISAEYYLLKGHMLYCFDDDAASSDNFSAGIDELDRSDDYSAEEKKYLLAYASSCHPRLNLPIAPVGEIETIDLGSVRIGLKMIFPLETHPRWDE